MLSLNNKIRKQYCRSTSVIFKKNSNYEHVCLLSAAIFYLFISKACLLQEGEWYIRKLTARSVAVDGLLKISEPQCFSSVNWIS